MRNNTKHVMFEHEDVVFAVDFRYSWFKGVYDVKVWAGTGKPGFNDAVKIVNCTKSSYKRFLAKCRSFKWFILFPLGVRLKSLCHKLRYF